MRKAICATLAAAALATSGVSVPTVASAASRHQNYDQQSNYVRDYCRHNNDSDCRDWNRNRGRWDEARYHRWYRNHRDHFGSDDAAAAIFGFVAGTAANIIANAATTPHVVACERASRSYDRRTDMFRTSRGWQRCRL